jgi:hypothetical protein
MLMSGSMVKRLSERRFAFLFFSLALFISIFGIIVMQSVYHSSYTIYASRLIEKPSRYFVLENPDVYVLKAMSSQDFVSIGSPEDTQIDDLINSKETSYFEYNGTYYGAGFNFETKYPPTIPFLLVLAGAIISASSLVGVAYSYQTRKSRLIN